MSDRISYLHVWCHIFWETIDDATQTAVSNKFRITDIMELDKRSFMCPVSCLKNCLRNVLYCFDIVIIIESGVFCACHGW